MNKLFFFFLLLSHSMRAQISMPSLPDSLFSTYYHQRVTHFQSLPQTKGDIIFAGNSITDGAEWFVCGTTGEYLKKMMCSA